jgi:hypothetical protein
MDKLQKGELIEEAICKQYLQVQIEGNRTVKRTVKYYNLNMILAIGYRARSHVGTQFRNWATGVLSEYMKKGFVLNDAQLKNPKPFGDGYFEELLARILPSEKEISWKEVAKYQMRKWNAALSPNMQSSIRAG